MITCVSVFLQHASCGGGSFLLLQEWMDNDIISWLDKAVFTIWKNMGFHTIPLIV